MASGLLIDYLGSGVIADRPAAPVLFADSVGLWWATDTTTLSAWDGATWTDIAGGGGSGDVVGPASSTNNVVAVFDGTTGKLLKDGATYLGQTSITTVGTIATGTWNATAVSAVKGGTGQTGYTVGDLLYASTTTALSKLAAGTSTHVLTSNGAGVAPSWQAQAGGGDVVGPASSTDGHVALFDGTSGTLLKDGGVPALDRSTASALATSGSVAIDYALGDYFTLALAGNVSTLTFSNLPGSGHGASLMVRITQDSTPRTVGWPASFKWAAGAAGAVSTGSGAIDVLAITTFDNGTTWDATLAKAFA